ncbi:sugar ABC transporter ATP-binding protein [Specibacter cremeus]|uniref:sugar ABC transporter ATP-binding protein n=1 Tax=Specibacter cremeus TaxID=1629051 RepID=UPI001F0C4DB6|nr:sugar ABC transporter ATP-binding protein [Specibacter cremeus]
MAADTQPRTTAVRTDAPPVAGGASPGILECTDIRIGFGGIPVLKGISLALEAGTVTALAGENGAGKSTLMKIASGQYRPDAGHVSVRGERLAAGDIQAAHRLGVAIVPQELASIPDMTVYENLFVGREPLAPLGLLDRRAMIRSARRDLAAFGLDLDPSVRMGSLPVGIRQIIEIVKATGRGARILLLDEPTSAIAEQEVERLYGVVRTLRDQGVAMLFTTHKMEEIRAMADRVVVLRDGALVEDRPLAELSDDDIVTAMIGRELEDMFPEPAPHGEDVVLAVRDLVLAEGRAPVSLQVRRGEILGLAGLVGAGRTELLESIFGMRRARGGAVVVHGKPLPAGNPAAAIGARVALVPEDRKGAGAVLSMNVLDNASLPRIADFSTAGWINNRKRTGAVGGVLADLRLKSRGLGQSMETLSGGNQQKVVFGRWLTGPVDVLLLDEPTRGVDVGARSEIYRIIVDLAARGMAVIMASSDMPEILSLAHRAFVLRDLTVAGELDRAALALPSAPETIFRLASGLDASTQKDTKSHEH